MTSPMPNPAPTPTPTPWMIYYDGRIEAYATMILQGDSLRRNPLKNDGPDNELVAMVAPHDAVTEKSKANASHIVRCVNSHAALVAALQALANCADEDGKFVQAPTAQMFKDAKAALALAEEGRE